MSNAIFPDLPGLKFDRVKKPTWSTLIKTAVSGKESRAALWTYPRYQYDLSYDVLRLSSAYQELATLMGFYLARQGAFDSFLYLDPSDSQCVGQEIGIGDGVASSFRLIRGLGGFLEATPNPIETTAVYLDGVAQTSGWSGGDLASAGVVTFVTPPTIGVTVTADFSYYFRCRFLDDSVDFSNSMYQIWELKKLSFITVK